MKWIGYFKNVFRLVFFFKQKTAYVVRICGWSSDVCSSDLRTVLTVARTETRLVRLLAVGTPAAMPDFAGVFSLVAELRQPKLFIQRSEERRVGKECVSTCRSRWALSH